VRTSGEWGALSGDLVDVPSGDATTTVYDVPVEVLGRAVHSGFQLPVDGDPASRPDVPFGGAEEQSFGPSDDVDGLLRADQVPALRNLPVRPAAPLPLDATQVFPILSDGLPSIVDDPVERLSGELPMPGSLPRARPGRGLPRMPARPGMPASPRQRMSGPSTEVLPRLGGPLPPRDQDTPAASAQQLMAQLRGLINELESGDSGRLRPLDVTSFHEPDAF
jgi:hypothetical protein